MKRRTRAANVGGLAVILTLGLTACGSNGSKTTTTAATHHASGFARSLFVNAVGLTHDAGGVRAVNGPDDMTYLEGHMFVGFQNGVGSMGESSPVGDKDSTIVEFDLQGRKVAQWDVVGKRITQVKVQGVAAAPKGMLFLP